MRISIILVIILLYCNELHSQVMTTDELLSILNKNGYQSIVNKLPFFKPEEIYYLNKDVAVECAKKDMDESISTRESPYYALRFAEFCTKNQKLAFSIFDFYNKKMAMVRNGSDTDFDLFSGHPFNFNQMIVALLSQMPEGLTDTLKNDLNFLHNEAKKIHPNTYSFFDHIWRFFANRLCPYRDYDYCLKGYSAIGKALIMLGEEDYVEKITYDLDSNLTPVVNNYDLRISTDLFAGAFYKTTLSIDTVNLPYKFHSIKELMLSDNRVLKDIFFKDWDTVITFKPILIDNNKALLYCAPRSFVYGSNGVFTIKIEFIDEQKVIFYLLAREVI